MGGPARRPVWKVATQHRRADTWCAVDVARTGMRQDQAGIEDGRVLGEIVASVGVQDGPRASASKELAEEGAGSSCTSDQATTH